VVAGVIAARFGLPAAFAGGALLALLAGTLFALVHARRLGSAG
jgi:hypothetical protein